MEVYLEKMDGTLQHALHTVAIVLHCPTNFDNLPYKRICWAVT